MRRITFPRASWAALAAAGLWIAAAAAHGQARIKDIADVQGARGNQLVGYGLVVGLDGTGDSNSTLFTAQSVVNALQRQGLNLPQGAIKVKNVAAVFVTAMLPAFTRNGAAIDVTVSSIGDARSLQGGTLLTTPLQGADGEVYAVAQGNLSIGGFNFSAGGSQTQKNHVNAGRIPGGATVEREVPTQITDGQTVEIRLKEADFTTAARVAEAVNAAVPEAAAVALDPYTVRVNLPLAYRDRPVSFIASVESLSVTPDTAARIVVNERTGTIVIGGDVRVSPCAIAHGGIQVKIENAPIVAIPAPFSEDGRPVVVPLKEVTAKEKVARLATIPATTSVGQLVKALSGLGLTPRDLIAILQAMRAAGHISAPIEVQ
ncbi:MAG: flagellar basal body P-ring protein FlgI [Chthonomonadales bacterium]|nr:flagellar basal body P-ring protein FlgI [Chthonomonadales bacterium]